MEPVANLGLVGDRHPALFGAGDHREERIRRLQPHIRVDPEIDVESGRIARQEGAYQKREQERRDGALGEVEVGARRQDAIAVPAQPLELRLGQTEIEECELQRRQTALSLDRQHHVTQEAEIAGIGGTDREDSRRHGPPLCNRGRAALWLCTRHHKIGRDNNSNRDASARNKVRGGAINS